MYGFIFFIMKETIKNENLEVCINTFGGYIESFTYKNNPVFFPKLLIKIKDSLKTRGGMHPCLPNFGEDEYLNLNVHGFGRDEFWEIIEKDENKIKLKLKGIETYKNVDFYIDYEIEKDKLKTYLRVDNKSNDKKLIAPGFHPYFYTGEEKIKFENFEIDEKKLFDTIFIDRDFLKFTLKNKEISINTKNAGRFAIWTDFYGQYICIEPTFNGKSFIKKEKDEPFILKKDQSFNMAFEIQAKEVS